MSGCAESLQISAGRPSHEVVGSPRDSVLPGDVKADVVSSIYFEFDPVGVLQGNEQTLEQVVTVRAPTDHAQTEVQLGRCPEADSHFPASTNLMRSSVRRFCSSWLSCSVRFPWVFC